MMKGVIDTFNEGSGSSMVDNQKVLDISTDRNHVRGSTFMRNARKEENTLLPPFKHHSVKIQDKNTKNFKFSADDFPETDSNHSEDMKTFNGEDEEKERFQKKLTFYENMKSVSTNGVLVNPFKDFEGIDEDNTIINKLQTLYSITKTQSLK